MVLCSALSLSVIGPHACQAVLLLLASIGVLFGMERLYSYMYLIEEREYCRRHWAIKTDVEVRAEEDVEQCR
jgi:hypothetical protein